MRSGMKHWKGKVCTLKTKVIELLNEERGLTAKIALYVVWEERVGCNSIRDIYRCCVWPVLLYCSEIWGLSMVDEARLKGVVLRIIRQMCGTRHPGRLLVLICIKELV